MKYVMLIMVLFSALAVQAKNCEIEPKEDVILSLDILEHKNVWPGFEKTSKVIFFTDSKKKKTYAYEIDPAHLTQLSISYEKCTLAEGISLYELGIEGKLPLNRLYHLYFPSETKEETADPLQKIANSTNISFTLVQVPNEYSLPAKVIARVTVHETFHGSYQFKSPYFVLGDLRSRDFYEKCSKNEDWMKSLETDLLEISQLLPVREKTDEELLSFVKSLKQRRSALVYGKEYSECYEATRGWERLEGTAQFVEEQAGVQSKIVTQEELDQEKAAASGLEIHKSPDFFYFSGNILTQINKRLKPNSWSKDIDEGAYLDLALFSLVKP